MSQIIEKLFFDYYGIKSEIKNRKINMKCTNNVEVRLHCLNQLRD